MTANLISSVLSQGTRLLSTIRASALAACTLEDLKCLMRHLERIEATLYNAEEREIRDHSVKLWLKELKSVAYDTEDVFSEYRYEMTRAEVEARKSFEVSGSRKRKQMEIIVPIPNGIANRLNKIRFRFEEIAYDRKALQFRESDGMRRANKKLLRPTGHMVDEASIFGRDVEIMEVIDLLLSKKKENPFSVISIIGKGGLGKTTIAQLVYKDARIRDCYDLFGWVCVSEDFDVRRLIKATNESISKMYCGLSELISLQEELAKTVKGKRILLVLDDVWNEQQSLWELFRIPLEQAKLVRILVTTRNDKVAEVMKTKAYFRPNCLSEHSCWQLFQHYAFGGSSHTVPTHFVEMGREIMRKCGGLPLAVKSIASLLRHETDDEKSWREILESGLWEFDSDIFPALQISYAHLPAHLKPCFLFCSMYPKDYTLEKMNLIQLWISHGYIKTTGKRKFTQVGIEYYKELQERSFLDDFSNRNSECCRLHDIIHDLARLNSENEHCSMEISLPLDDEEGNILQEAYHLYARGFMGYLNQISQQNVKGLRTLSIDLTGTETKDKNLKSLRSDNEGCWGNTAPFDITKFEALRVLELKGDCLIDIPCCIVQLKHLSHLRITSDCLKMLPLSIGLLYNLQTFILDCYRSPIKFLPDSMGDLANLQYLCIQCAHLNKLPKSLGLLSNLRTLVIKSDELEKVPPYVGMLPNLQEITIVLQ